MGRVRITVLQKSFFPELANTYLTDGEAVGPCDLLEEGQVYTYEGDGEKPSGFCPWAWADLFRYVCALAAGADYSPWHKQTGAQLRCCSDGVRPVAFLLECID